MFGSLLADARALIPAGRCRLGRHVLTTIGSRPDGLAVTTPSESSPLAWMTAFDARRFAAPIRPGTRPPARTESGTTRGFATRNGSPPPIPTTRSHHRYEIGWSVSAPEGERPVKSEASARRADGVPGDRLRESRRSRRHGSQTHVRSRGRRRDETAKRMRGAENRNRASSSGVDRSIST
jgi:hypothetical protein